METEGGVMCPVCTLYLRPGMTLGSHLSSHPKQMVIEALVRLSGGCGTDAVSVGGEEFNNVERSLATIHPSSAPTTFCGPESSPNGATTDTVPWNATAPAALQAQTFPHIPNNHSFIYQQIVSTSTPHPATAGNILNLEQQPSYVMINQTHAPPPVYIYHHQQQQVIMSANASILPQSNLLGGDRRMPELKIIEQEEQEQESLAGIDEDDSEGGVRGGSDVKGDVGEEDDDAGVDNVNEFSDHDAGQQDKADSCRSEVKCDYKIVINIDDRTPDGDELSHADDCDLSQDAMSPRSVSSEYLKVRGDLNKSIQTDSEDMRWASNSSEPTSSHQQIVDESTSTSPLPALPSTSNSSKCSLTRSHNTNTMQHHHHNHYGSPSPTALQSAPQQQHHAVNKSSFFTSDCEDLTECSEYITLQNSNAANAAADSLYASNVIIGASGVQVPSTRIQSGSTDSASQRVVMEASDGTGVGMVLGNDFMAGHVINPVEHFDFTIKCDRSESVLMDLTPTNNYHHADQHIFSANAETSSSTALTSITDLDLIRDGAILSPTTAARSVACIRTDERMPPRGELSGQESNASNMTWTTGHNFGCEDASNHTVENSRYGWESDEEERARLPPPPYRSPQPSSMQPVAIATTGNVPTADVVDMPTFSGFEPPPIRYKCPRCPRYFSCQKERKSHQRAAHGVVKSGAAATCTSQEALKNVDTVIDNVVTNNFVGRQGQPLNITSDIAIVLTGHTRPVKKLVIKPKQLKVLGEQALIKSEDARFDFSENLKMETTEELTDTSSPVNKLLLLPKKEDRAGVHDALLPTSGTSLATTTRGQVDRYKCATCLETFTSDRNYQAHLKIHPLECRMCGRYFYRRANLQLHMKRHLGIRPFKCLSCEKSFLTRQKLEEHRTIHTGETPIKCAMCDKSFRRYSNLIAHKNKYHLNHKIKVKDYICDCGEIFHTQKKLAWHRETHETKPKACPHCSEKFVHMASLTRHMRRTHNERFMPREERQEENVECHICKGVFLKASLDVHIKTHSGERPFTCPICNKDFTTKWNLKLHKWTHASRSSKPFKCDQCKSAFIRESDYIAHKNSHKALKPFTCNHCGAQFIRKSNCLRHVREHEKGKTYVCEICNKAFHRSYYLNDHMRVHSGAKPYSCNICGKTSSTKSNHNKHVRIHHAREPVSTEN